MRIRTVISESLAPFIDGPLVGLVDTIPKAIAHGRLLSNATGQGYWFGYGRTFGFHLGDACQEDVRNMASDPFYWDSEIGNLFLSNMEIGYNEKELKNRVLSTEEAEAVVFTIIEKAHEYNGIAQQRMFERAAEIAAVLDGVRGKVRIDQSQKEFDRDRMRAGLEEVLVDAVQKQGADPDLLMRGFDIRSLEKIDTAISTPYLEAKIKKLWQKRGWFEHEYKYKDRESEQWKFHLKMLGGIGLMPHYYGNKYPVHTSEKMVDWLPLIERRLIDGDLRPIANVSPDIYGNNFLTVSNNHTDYLKKFFGSFPFERAYDFLMHALDNNVRYALQLASTSKSGENIVDMTFEVEYPIAEGAKQSLIALKAKHPSLAAEDAIGRFEAKPREYTMHVEVREETRKTWGGRELRKTWYVNDVPVLSTGCHSK